MVVFVTKLLLLWLDPTPKLFMGDSGAYIWTALTGWIPSDRSYLYGYLVRWLAVWPHSFLPLLAAQALASGVTAIVFARICSAFFGVSNRLSFLFGFLCALDPCQLVWERYVMTETFSLLVYVLVLYRSLLYVRDRRLWELAVVQALSVVLIAFRIGYLLVVQVCTVLLPIIAFARCASPAFRNRSEARSSVTNPFSTGFEHVVVSVALMNVMHDAYKHVNASFAKREPAYLYDAGAHLAAVWAPALQPSDATDPRFRDLIANGDQFEIDNLRQRNAQQFSDGFLMGRWSKIEKDPYKRDRIAKETAINALRRRPLEIVELTLKTIPAEPCRERAGQRGNNDDEVIRPSSKKVSLYKRERLRWERFHRRKSKLFSEQVDVIIGQLSIAEILSCIPINGSDAPISQISLYFDALDHCHLR